MNTLLFDSSFNQLQMALIHSEHYKFISDLNHSRYELSYGYNTERVALGEVALDLLDQVLTEAQVALSDIDYIAFDRGPGSFVGTRIATSLTQGLLTADPKAKAIALSSLAMVAAQVHYLNHLSKSQMYPTRTKLIVALDANMRESYVGVYQAQGPNDLMPRLLGKEMLLTIDQLVTMNRFVEGYKEVRYQIYDDNPFLAELGLKNDETYLTVGNAWGRYVPQAMDMDLSHKLGNVTGQLTEKGKIAQEYLAILLNDIGVISEKTASSIRLLADVFANLTQLPDLRLQAAHVTHYIDAQEFTPRLALEPTYIRDKVTY